MVPWISDDVYFASLLADLIRASAKSEPKREIRAAENYVIERHSLRLALLLGIELCELGIRSKRLENFIVRSKSSRYILKFARQVQNISINKFERAIMKHGSIIDIARFGCFVERANKHKIAKLLVNARNPKAVYFYLRFVKPEFYSLTSFKRIIMESKRPRYLFALAKLLRSKSDVDRTEDLIIESSSDMYVRLFATYIQGANIKRLEARMVESMNVVEMKRFANSVSAPRIDKLLLLL